MNDRAAIEKRISQFIADYADWEQRCNQASGHDISSFPLPCELIESTSGGAEFDPTDPYPSDRDETARTGAKALSQEHCHPADLLLRHGYAYGSPLRHDPLTESIVSIEQTNETALVKTHKTDGWLNTFEYELRKMGAKWKITRIQEFGGEDTRSERQQWQDADFVSKFDPIDDVGIDFETAFKAGTRAYNNEERKEGVLHLVDGGEIHIPSGVLVAADPAWPADARPLAVRVPLTTLPVELMQVEGWNAFARVTLKPDQKPCAWVPAFTISERDQETPTQPFEVGTRCGAFVLCDAEVWQSMSSHEGERFCTLMVDQLLSESRPLAISIPVPPVNTGIALAIARGGGDFSCPCYWGINSEGEPVHLVIDLLICGDNVAQSFDLEFDERHLNSSRPLAALTEFGFDVRVLDTHTGTLEVHSEGNYASFDLIDADNHVLSSTDHFGLSQTGTIHTQYLARPESGLNGTRLRARWQTWKHAFARPAPSF